MRIPRVSSTLLIALLLVGITLIQAQDQSDDSGAPKRVLKKYRVRRPVVVDDQGNVVRAGPKLRRVRVKNPRQKVTVDTSTQAPIVTVVTSTSTTPTLVSSTVSSSSQPQQYSRQRITVNPTQNSIPLERQVRPQTVFFEEPAIVEQVRTVPAYRQAISQANRDQLLANVNYKPSRGTGGVDDEKKVGTVRNYSRINEDGSFTFGYEAEDGSFKEETRGVDCVVRGKYGYIDPEGVRREFEYVSGNPCDPNDPDKEDKSDEEEEEGLTPSRPIIRKRIRPTELTENNIQQGLQQIVEERIPEDQLVNFRPAIRQRIRPQNLNGIPQQGLVLRQRVRITTPRPRPTFASNQVENEEEEEQPALVVRQRPFTLSSPRPTIYNEVSQSLEDNRPPLTRQLFNFDQEVHRLAAISRPQNQPQPLYEQPFRQVHHQPNPAGRQIFGNSAFRQEQATASPPTTSGPTPTSPSGNTNSNFGRYRTELVYDPRSGQYTSVLVQANPNSNQEFELTQKLRAFSVNPSPSPTPTTVSSPSHSTPQNYPSPTPATSYTQIQQLGQPQIQYYHHSPEVQQGRSANPSPSGPPQHQQQQQQQIPINQYLARHAYQVQQQQQQHQQQQLQQQQQPQSPAQSVNNLQFIPPHLRPGVHQTAEIQRQEVREIAFPSQGLSANSASASSGQIDAFLKALNISI